MQGLGIRKKSPLFFSSVNSHIKIFFRVLQEQAGNSLEMSLLLVSLLRGLGYKVYVVLGDNIQQERCCSLDTQHNRKNVVALNDSSKSRLGFVIFFELISLLI